MGLLREIPVGYAAGNWYLRLYEDAVSQSIESNTSTLTLRLTLYADRSTWVEFDRRDAWIGGSHFAIAYHHSNGEHELGSTTFPINHNDDGTRSYDIDFGISTSYALNGSGNGGRTLPTIPRASSFTISGNTLGSPVTVNISRASSSFTHTIHYGFGDMQRDYTGISTSHTFTPPLDDAFQIPNTVSGTGGITVYTYNGGTYIGSKSLSLTLSLPGNYGPSYSSLSIARIDNGVPASWGIYVQGKSKATLTINGATGIYGSSIAGASISGGGYSASSSPYTTGVLGAGDITFTGTITDTRGRSISKTATIKVYECSAPSLQLKAERCTSKGISDNFGTYVKITPTYTYASVNGKNTITAKSFAITGTSYKNTTCASGASVILGNNDIAIAKSYEVTGVISDALSQSSSTIKITIPSSSVPLNIRDDARGIGLGKYGEVQDAVDCAWNIYSKGKRLANVDEPSKSLMGRIISGVGVPEPKDAGLFYMQTTERPTLLPDSSWWHLLRMQHPNYENGYWVDLAFSFFSKNIQIRTNSNGNFTDWEGLVTTNTCPELTGQNGWDEQWKFPNGLAILRKSVTIQTAWHSWGNMYESNWSLSPIAYPAGLYINAPTLLAGRTGLRGSGFLVEFEGSNSISKSPTIYLARPNDPGILDLDVSIVVIGRWK